MRLGGAIPGDAPVGPPAAALAFLLARFRRTNRAPLPMVRLQPGVERKARTNGRGHCGIVHELIALGDRNPVDIPVPGDLHESRAAVEFGVPVIVTAGAVLVTKERNLIPGVRPHEDAWGLIISS